LYSHRPLLEESAHDKVAARQTAGLVSLAIILLLLIVGLFLVRQLRASAVIEDCLMSGRRNCDILVTEAH
jgi:hypothetical protein